MMSCWTTRATATPAAITKSYPMDAVSAPRGTLAIAVASASSHAAKTSSPSRAPAPLVPLIPSSMPPSTAVPAPPASTWTASGSAKDWSSGRSAAPVDSTSTATTAARPAVVPVRPAGRPPSASPAPLLDSRPTVREFAGRSAGTDW